MAPKAISEKSNAPPADNLESAPGSCAGEAALPRVGVVVNELSVDEVVDDIVINAPSVDIGIDELSVDVLVELVPDNGGSVISVPP